MNVCYDVMFCIANHACDFPNRPTYDDFKILFTYLLTYGCIFYNFTSSYVNAKLLQAVIQLSLTGRAYFTFCNIKFYGNIPTATL